MEVRFFVDLLERFFWLQNSRWQMSHSSDGKIEACNIVVFRKLYRSAYRDSDSEYFISVSSILTCSYFFPLYRSNLSRLVNSFFWILFNSSTVNFWNRKLYWYVGSRLVEFWLVEILAESNWASISSFKEVSRCTISGFPRITGTSPWYVWYGVSNLVY